MKKISCIVIMLCVLCFGTSAIVNAENTSLPSEWAVADINQAETVGLIPNNIGYIWKDEISRESFCDIIYNMLIVTEIILENIKDVSMYPDTSSIAVNTLNHLEIVFGDAEGLFHPHDAITREEAASVLYRIYKLCKLQELKIYYTYNDDEKISEWAKEGVYLMQSNGIMKGSPEAIFDPKVTLTHEQAVSTIIRIYNKIVQ